MRVHLLCLFLVFVAGFFRTDSLPREFSRSAIYLYGDNGNRINDEPICADPTHGDHIDQIPSPTEAPVPLFTLARLINDSTSPVQLIMPNAIVLHAQDLYNFTAMPPPNTVYLFLNVDEFGSPEKLPIKQTHVLFVSPDHFNQLWTVSGYELVKAVSGWHTHHCIVNGTLLITVTS
ncbi:unnamed protein product [Echinostoma caproni]|uniref:Secreted protein n=1 Tax=Echinostoma caproni TaxID=27848 RepID=A0A183B1W9_9TREM|nr:unnamed protein product [Echinostoma caproni]